MKKGLYLLLVVCMILALVAGCSGSTKGPAVLNVCIASQPETIDPQLNTSVDGATLINHAFEGLMKIDSKQSVVPAQAKSYKISDDGLTYTFTLRDDIKWSDGQAVKAGDFVYAWQRLIDPKTASQYNYMIEPVKGCTEIINAADPTTVTADQVKAIGIAAPDDKTVVVTLAQKCAYFLEICSFPGTYPVRQDIIAKYGDQWTLDPKSYIGNGPYVLKEWVANASMTYEKNKNFYDLAKLGPTQIKFALMDNQDSMLAAYKNNTLSMIDDVPTAEIPALKAGGELHIEGQLGTYYIAFNNQKAPFDNEKVREAFSLVIDRNFIVDKVAQNGAQPATAYVPTGLTDNDTSKQFRTVGGDYYSVKADDYKANCDKARQLLSDAGFPGGKGFPAVEYLYNTSNGHKAIAEALQNMWQTELGVTITISNQDWAVFLKTRQNGDFQIARDGWLADFNDPITFLNMFVTGGGNDDPHYANSAYDALIKQINTSGDRAERMKLMHQAEDMLMKDNAVAPIYFYTDLYMIKPNVQGFYASPLGYKYFMYCTLK